MFLAKIHIAPSKANNAYELHRALWQLFPDRPDEQRPFLFRVENHRRQLGAHILLQSDCEPAHTSEHARCLACKPVQYQLQAGQLLRFHLRANPVKAIKDERKGSVVRNGHTYIRSVRVPIIDEGQQRQWLENKFKQAGVALNAVQITQEAPLYFKKGREKRSGKIQPVLFDGLLQVLEPDSLVQALGHGIGPAKSFGMGLLSLSAG